MAGTVATAGLAAATGGIIALGAGLVTSINAAMDSQKGQAQLAAVLKSTGGAAGMTADAVNDLASRFQAITPFEDDAVLAGENMLLTFTNIGKDVFPLATEAMLNMATAMGTDAESGAVQLGKALNDPIAGISALSRVGVTFTEEQKATIQSMVDMGDVAGAQKLILAELNKEFGGSAEAAGNTLPGKLEILKNTFGDIQEAIGTAFLPVLSSVADMLASGLNSPATQAALAGLTNWISETAIPALQNFASEFMGAFQADGLSGVLSLLQEKIAGAWPVIQETLAGWARGFWDWLVGPGGATSTLGATFTMVIGAIRDFIVTNWPAIQLALTEWSNNFWQWVLGPGGALEKTAAALDAIMLRVQTWVTANQPLLQAEGVKIGGFMMDALTILFNNQEKVNTVIGTLLASIGRAVIGLVTTSNAAGASIGTGIINGMINQLTGANASSSLVQALKDLVGQVMNAFNPIQQITQGIQGLSGGGGGGFPGFASGGSFIVPGSGSGDRPFMLGLTPGERVSVAPQGGGGGGLAGATFNIFANSEGEGQAAGRGLVEELRRRGLL